MTTIYIELNDSQLRAVDDKLSARGISVSEAVQQWLEGFATESAHSPATGRYERELQEDRERWQRYQDTGRCIQQSEMIAWTESLIEQAKTSDGE